MISIVFLLAIDCAGNKIKNEILDAVISIVMMKTEQQLQHKQQYSLSYDCRSAERLSTYKQSSKTELFDTAYCKREHSA